MMMRGGRLWQVCPMPDIPLCLWPCLHCEYQKNKNNDDEDEDDDDDDIILLQIQIQIQMYKYIYTNTDYQKARCPVTKRGHKGQKILSGGKTLGGQTLGQLSINRLKIN